MAIMSRYAGVIAELKSYAKRCTSRARHPRAKFVIFGPSRSGSTLLVTLLNSHPQIRCEDEILHDRVLFPMAYISSRAALACEEVYGFKLLAYQLRNVQKIQDPERFLHDLVCGGFECIYLRRHNLLRWALSNLYARSTARFHHWKAKNGEMSINKMHVDLVELEKWLRWGVETEAFTSAIMARLPHLSLVYEEDHEASTQHQRTVDRICDCLGLSRAPIFLQIWPR